MINRITRQVTPVDLNELDITSSSILSFHFDGKISGSEPARDS